MKETRRYHYSIEEIKRIVTHDDIKVVSFDLFDTLLVRPSMRPRDIFYLLQNAVRRKYGLDFVELRMHAEEELGKENATLPEIWEHIRKKHALEAKTAEDLMAMELELETRLLTVRDEMLSVLHCAKEAGKRVIVTSDMYIGGQALLGILKAKGIEAVEAVYVSCDYGKRKDTGELYGLVAEKERLSSPAQIAHIGDNFQSDYQKALEVGVTGIYYPSIWEDMYGAGRPWEPVLGENCTEDPYMRLLVSYSMFHAYLSKGRELGEARCFTDVEDLAAMYLGNVTVAAALELMNSKDIQTGYDRISFAARDGFLPMKVYDLLSADTDALPSHYLYASRQALSYTSYTDYFDYYDNIQWSLTWLPYTLENYIKLTIVDNDVKETLLAAMSEAEKSIDLSKDSCAARKVLLRFKKPLNQHFLTQRQLAERYYADQFKSDAARYLIFDLGYSGSVSLGLMKAGLKEKYFDKYYIYEAPFNKQRDKEYGTKTICLTGEFVGELDVVLEECFSPPEGSCLGFADSGDGVIPVKGDFTPDKEMLETLERMHTRCIKHAEGFKALFAPYFDCFRFTDKTILSKIGYHALVYSPYMELSLLKPIRFADTLSGGVPIELSKKVYDSFAFSNLYPTVFSGTQYMNPENWLEIRRSVVVKGKIGIHLHLHYLFLLEEFIGYLRDFPADFDLIITTTQPQSIDAIRLHCTVGLPRLKKLVVLPVENRGRDVGPWLVATKPYQNDYDLFCHLHGKASAEYTDGTGQKWRRYLFDNLISHNAAADIIELFAQNEDLGCVFPDYFDCIAQIHINNSIIPIGEYGEPQMIEHMMQQMHIDRLFSRDDMLYSAGTMLWYRPDALKPLFDIGFTMDDFPPEPTPVGETIMHAIERVPGLVCAERGYKTAIFNEYPQKEWRDISAPIRERQSTDNRSWRGHGVAWYVKKSIKSLVPYGILRVWQRLRYGI